MPIVLGVILDYYLNWTPWGVVCGTVLGFVGGLLHLLALLKRFDKEQSDKPPEKPED
jgi:F0F1-type ATP synthase assembly protein I